MSSAVIRTSTPGLPWRSVGPFYLASHHLEAYPRGNGRLGPERPPTGDDQWQMYYGVDVPGFPAHPHSGFETITFVRRGIVDHADSAGGAARYGDGDIQWLTAGRGIQHAEMFPLIDVDRGNPLEFFQIWLNLAAADKSAEPHIRMFWADDVPHARAPGIDVTVVAGSIDGAAALAPPPHSWASRPESDVAIWHIELQSGATWTLPPARRTDSVRALFVVAGDRLLVDATDVAATTRVDLRSDLPATLTAGEQPVRALLLQGVPIPEPIAAGGPFVMNTAAELDAALHEFRTTQYGGWPWPTTAHTHGPDPRRFLRRPDGAVERPPKLPQLERTPSVSGATTRSITTR